MLALCVRMRWCVVYTAKNLARRQRGDVARASSSAIFIMRHLSTIDRCVPKHLDVVNARVVSMAVVVQNFEQQRVRERGRAAVGLLAHKDLWAKGGAF